MAKTAGKRRNHMGPTKRRAAIVLFVDGMHPKNVGRLLGLSTDEVLNVLRRHKARR